MKCIHVLSDVDDLSVIKLKVTEDGYPKTGVQPFSGDPGDDPKKKNTLRILQS